MAEGGVSMDQGRQSEGSDPVRSVLVRGLSQFISKEKLLDYMELPRRSGGGPVESIHLNRREMEAVVTFERPEDAARVADPSRRHVVKKTLLDVSLHRPAPPLSNCLQVCPVPDFDSPDLLRSFVAKYTGCDVDKILYGFMGEDESAVIFFANDIDVKAARTALASQPFNNGGALNVATLPSWGVLLVRGLPPGVAEDTLRNYFENPRCGKAGEITKVKMCRDNHGAYALVSLQNPEVAPRVLAQRHTIDNCDLDVSLYLDCLGPGGGSTKRQLKIPATTSDEFTEARITLQQMVASAQGGDVTHLETALERTSVRPASFPMDPSHLRLLQLYLNTGMLQDNLLQEYIHFDHDKSMITTTGTIEGRQKILDTLTNFSAKIVTDTLEFTEPSFKEFITSQQGEQELKKVEDDTKCTIRVDNLDAGRVQGSPSLEFGWNSPGTADGQQPGPREFFVLDHPWEDLVDPAEEIPDTPKLFLRHMNDITSEEHDVLVNSSNPELNLAMGQVSQDLLRVGGKKLQDDCRAKYPEGIKMGDVAVTNPGRTKEDTKRDSKWRLMCKRIHHCCLPQTTDQNTMRMVVKEAVTKCLTLAERDEMKSIGFPALGTGILKYPAALVAEVMYEAALEYGRKNPGSQVAEVFFIVHKKDTENSQVFLREDEKHKDKLKKKEQARKAADYVLPMQTEEGLKSWSFFESTRGRVLLKVDALQREHIQRAREELLKAYENQVETSTWDARRLAEWDQPFIEQAAMACKAQDLDVIFNFNMGRLLLRGLRTHLTQVQLRIIIDDAEAEVNEREQAMLIIKTIQWCWTEVDAEGTTVYRPYDAMNNFRIEKAYRNDSGQATVYDNNKVPYKVDFDRMKEIPEHAHSVEDAEDAIDVVRCDIKTALTPHEAPAPVNWTGNKTMDVVTLNPNSDEHGRIAQRFKESLRRPGVNVVAIERIQNLTLYRQYMCLRKDMSSRFRGQDLEREPLWHGTKEENVAGIIKYGFNRRYCERNRYGQGVYFAITAENSSEDKYAPRNASGERRMFYCKVLIGKYMKGDENLRVLPHTHDSAVDLVEDPSMFIVFKDMQAYPMYLIVFKDN